MRFALILSCTLFLMAPIYADDTTALHLDWLNPTISPRDDFYAYANGGWQKKNPIPADRAIWGTFSILQEETLGRVHQILIDAAKNTKNATNDEKKIGDFYYSGMDEKAINAEGVRPLTAEFARIQSIQNVVDLQAEVAHLHQIGVNAFFNFGSMQDFKESTRMIAAVMQAGLGLPDRDYYLNDDAKFKKIRSEYLHHIQTMFELLGSTSQQAAKDAESVMQIETALAKVSLTKIEQRDPHAIYHLMNREQLAKASPQFSWASYFNAMGQANLQNVNIGMPGFITGLNELLAKTPGDKLKLYLRWRLIDDLAPYLSASFENEDFRMVTILTGVEKMQPRWKRVVQAEENVLGFAIGELYVKKYLSPETRAQVLEILNNIHQVLRTDLPTLSWMTPATRKAALVKLGLMEERVGYPSKWRDYSKLVVDRGPYVVNIMRANQFLVQRDLNKIGKPVDRTEWDFTPQTINAYYNPSMNNINILSGILQPPFFDAKAPAAMNYGAIGFVIGHEITHGFDDEGAKFDGKGNLKDWWSPEDLKKFEQATTCIAEQFSQYKVDNVNVKGKLVVGEAAADLGGLTLAYRAFQNSKAYKNAPTIEGFTPEQQFFISSAHVWASNVRPELSVNLLTVDPHPPMVYRVNGTLANMPAFQAAFNVPADSPLFKKQQCVIW